MLRLKAIPDVFGVISDPTRRQILDLLRVEPMNVSQIVAQFDVTQSAISQHLKLLRDAGVVGTERRGKRIFYHLNAAALVPLFDWAESCRKFWKTGLESLGSLLSDLAKNVNDTESRKE